MRVVSSEGGGLTCNDGLQSTRQTRLRGQGAHPMVTRSFASPTAALMARLHATVKACVMRPSSAAKSDRFITTRPSGSLLLSRCFTLRSCTEIMSHFLSKGPSSPFFALPSCRSTDRDTGTFPGCLKMQKCLPVHQHPAAHSNVSKMRSRCIVVIG